jgi:large subunit ribosomal protein L14e
MPAIEIGRICVKLMGREAGKKCVVVDLVDKNFVLITGPYSINKVKRRRANTSHIEPTKIKVALKRGATDEEIVEALREADKLEEISNPAKLPNSQI